MSGTTKPWASLLCLGAFSLCCAAGAPLGQEGKPIEEKPEAKALFDSLRDVINSGADLFNNQRDYAGCYRLYQGALLSVRPFLTKELQTKVDSSLASAERMPRMAERAFELRSAIDAI